ncbi:hypothetical protein DICPUDRAFT_148568 [Dictyostelium purpureum]|uniref:tRNA:m(4)X modification enzyme TRM13 n=1 Tax=Dictyostelium purpureum TaxID=5786 RepID=F0ZBG4_DICPU|nr:uncharacterized protein DICPUDRAFT_148568 [Dictyostelium purpureum]EGC38742.1 hypothetical protein DICPUDRAFT_148568 [Dictyostelium purpureum]|eukprot:XP_003284733.1 hypothetical protein DICPUDRAFT_148568 [Dictyostelium purpureum]
MDELNNIDNINNNNNETNQNNEINNKQKFKLSEKTILKNEKKKKKIKIDHSIPLKEKPNQEDIESHNDCLFWIVNKKKHRAEFCKFKRTKDSTFCTIHKTIDNTTTDTATPTKNEGKKDTSIRIVCPLDPTHTIYKHNLKKHLKGCSGTKLNQREAHLLISKQQDFYKENVNNLNGNEKLDSNSLALSQVTNEELELIAHKLDQFFEKYYPNGIKVSNNIHKTFNNLFNQEQILKHIQQESSIISLLELNNLYNENNIYLEFGAGSGKLSNHIFQSHEKKSGHILIDRMKFRSLHKIDRYIKNEATCRHFERLLVDIRHLDLSKLSALEKHPFVITSKHLCGCATDFTLDCISNLLKSNNSELFKNNFSGLGLATCCHHHCSYDTYINQPFLKNELNLTAKEFQLICSISSWATIDENKLDEKQQKQEKDQEQEQEELDEELLKEKEKENQLKLDYNNNRVFSNKRKEELGYKAKRLIDYGRYLYIKENFGLPNTDFFIYTNQSKENFFLISSNLKRNLQ